MKGRTTGKSAAGMQISGAFNAKRFFETLALIISRKENLSVTVTVHEGVGSQEKEAV